MNNTEYWKEVRETAANIVLTVDDIIQNQGFKETMEQGYRDEITYETLHETIDSHEYAIYYHHHLPVLEHSYNAEHMVDEFGDDGIADIVNQGGIQGLHAALAFWAFYADVMNELNS